MRFALCDDDPLYVGMIEIMLANLGHELVGVATTPADSTAPSDAFERLKGAISRS